MTLLTGGLGRLQLGCLTVLDLQVAVRAIDLVVAHMHPMHQIDIFIAVQALPLAVTGKAALLRDIASRGVGNFSMTPLTVHVEAVHVSMVKAHQSDLDHLIRDHMTKCTAAGSLAHFHILEVAEDTG
jgi:hypothetical protein